MKRSFAEIWRKIHRSNLAGVQFDRAAIDPNHPQAPKSHPHHKNHPHPFPSPQDLFAKKIVAYADMSLNYAGRMTYTETAARSVLFHRAPGRFVGASADCSQYVAAILHWLGNKEVTEWDYTGSLIHKGKPLALPAVGCVAIWGDPTVHTAFITEHIKGGSDWYCVGFGHPGAPDRNTLHGMNAYFEAIGHPGVQFRMFS